MDGGWSSSVFAALSSIEVAAVRSLFVTVFDTVSFDFAIETLVIFHQFFLFGFRMLYSSAVFGCVNIHVISPLGGGATSASIVGVSSTPVIRVPTGRDSKDSVHGLLSVLAVLFRSLLFEVLVACFFFPIFEFPGNFCGQVITWGSYNCFDKFPFQIVFQDFDSSMIIKFDVGIFGQSLEVCKEAVKAFTMSEFAEFLVCFCPSVCIGEGFEERIHEVIPKGFVNFKCSASDLIIKVV